ncbi:hypothetical protein BC941DRAFT_430611 [Chlamydoabsidia padenii]|nr:hypothetical protein BC941DRAFT_430611 [Chlamydoabsidia padenii]
MSSNNTNIPFLSSNDMDQFDQKMASIMQSSISMMFRQLIEPVDSGKYDIDTSKTLTTKQPPPLKLHDFGGSDFVRLAEKSRRNRTCISSRSQGMMVSSLDRPTPMNKTYNSSSKHNENINSLTLMDKTGKEQEQQEQQEQQQGSSILNNKVKFYF